MSIHDTAVGFPAAATTPQWGELQLVSELRLGSAEAFNYLISLYHQALYRFVIRIVGNGDDAADILQETFLKVFRGAAHFEGKSSLKTWLYQIALHEASNHRRWWWRHKRQETSLEAEDGAGGSWAQRLPDGRESPLSLALRKEQREQLQRALRRVPEPYHAVLVLREIEGFSYEEIAEIAQVRIGTVKSRLLRGREMLRQSWQREGRAEPAAPRAPAGARDGPATGPDRSW
ncbi:MAG: RNA polymerase sigma factor, partial [Terriglobales bacterium]